MSNTEFFIIGASNAKIMATYLDVKFLKLKNLKRDEVNRFVKLDKQSFPKLAILYPPTNELMPGSRYYDNHGKLHTHRTAHMKRPNSRELKHVINQLTTVISTLESEKIEVRLMCNFIRAFENVCDCQNHIFHHAHRQIRLFKTFESLTMHLASISGITLEFTKFVCSQLEIQKPKTFTDRTLISVYKKILQKDNLHLNNVGMKIVASYMKEKLILSIARKKCFQIT